MGIYFLGAYLINPLNGLPKQEDLIEVQGRVEWVKRHKYGVKFKFKDETDIYNYMSKIDAVGKVKSSLSNAGDAVVSVLIKPNDISKNLITDEQYNDVYQVKISGRFVRSYGEVKEAWASDNKIGLYMGPIFILAAIYLFRKARKGEYGSSQIY